MKLLYLTLTIAMIFTGNCVAGSGDRIENYQYTLEFPSSTYEDYGDSISNELYPEKYPIYGFMLSLALPGAGQWYGEASWFRTGLFTGLDLAGLLAWIHFENESEKVRSGYEQYADESWFLDTWIWNTELSRVSGWNAYSDIHLLGSHSLYLHLSGAAREQFGEYISSDRIDELISAFPGIGEDSEYTASLVNVVRDRDFYENIGKYDQFVGGWIDARSGWYAESKKVEKTSETIIMTPRKKFYINERNKNNLLLNYGKYTVSAIMFNHVISALDAMYMVLRHNSSLREKANVSLTFDNRNSFGIGGIKLSISF